jgi:hypothetical protein
MLCCAIPYCSILGYTVRSCAMLCCTHVPTCLRPTYVPTSLHTVPSQDLCPLPSGPPPLGQRRLRSSRDFRSGAPQRALFISRIPLRRNHAPISESEHAPNSYSKQRFSIRPRVPRLAPCSWIFTVPPKGFAKRGSNRQITKRSLFRPL